MHVSRGYYARICISARYNYMKPLSTTVQDSDAQEIQSIVPSSTKGRSNYDPSPVEGHSHYV